LFQPHRYLPYVHETSPIKNNNFHLMSPLHIHHGIRVVLDLVLFSKLVHSTHALYAVSVRRCETLLTASFRFHLAVDTLAVRLMVPTTKPIEDFHLRVIAHVGRTSSRRWVIILPTDLSHHRTSRPAYGGSTGTNVL
jgi:hypothetical protein